MTYRHLFGPVPSRRLGRSLGIDLTPFKTCSLDCIFCQLGRTKHQTLNRADYVPIREVKSEIEAWLKDRGTADYITLAGSGEPTLHARFGDMLRFIHDQTAIPTALLSNGTLFDQPEVRAAACHADLVKLSLSAWDTVSFGQVNRPHPDLDFQRIIDGYRTFRDMYHGTLWLEVFLVWGTNSVQRDVERIAAIAESIAPDEIHLNTATRPPAESFAFAMPRREMQARTALFQPTARVIAEFSTDSSSEVAVNEDTILATLQRRPCTALQLAEVFGMHRNEVAKYIGKLLRTDRIRSQDKDNETYYVAVACLKRATP